MWKADWIKKEQAGGGQGYRFCSIAGGGRSHLQCMEWKGEASDWVCEAGRDRVYFLLLFGFAFAICIRIVPAVMMKVILKILSERLSAVV